MSAPGSGHQLPAYENLSSKLHHGARPSDRQDDCGDVNFVDFDAAAPCPALPLQQPIPICSICCSCVVLVAGAYEAGKSYQPFTEGYVQKKKFDPSESCCILMVRHDSMWMQCQ